MNFVAHSLKLPATKETNERISQALEELSRAGQIHYKGEEGKRHGRGTGWGLGRSPSTPAPARERGQRGSAQSEAS